MFVFAHASFVCLIKARPTIQVEILLCLTHSQKEEYIAPRLAGDLWGFGLSCVHVQVPRCPTRFADPFIQNVAWAPKLWLILAPSFSPIGMHFLLGFKEAGGLLDARVSCGVQHFWLKIKT